MRAIFRICGNESQPGLQRVEKLATPLAALSKMYTGLSCKGGKRYLLDSD